MQLVLVFSGNVGITVNPKYLFITSSYFMGLTIFLITHNQQVNPINEINFTHKCQEN